MTSSPATGRWTRRCSRIRTVRARSGHSSSITCGSRSTSGWIRESVAYAQKAPDGSKTSVRRSLAEGLGLPNDPAAFVIFRDARTGLETIRSCSEVWDRGLHVHLDAYGSHVFWEFREVFDGVAGQWGRLAERLGGAAVPSLEESLRELQLEPVHGPLRAVFANGLVGAVLDGTAEAAQLDEVERRFAAFLAAVAAATGVDGDPRALAAAIRTRAGAAMAAFGREDDAEVSDPLPAAASSERPAATLDRPDRAALLGWIAFGAMGELAPGADVAATSRAWYDELRLPGAFATGLHEAAFDEATAWSVADLVRVLLSLARPSSLGGLAADADARLLEAWLGDPSVRAVIGVNTWEGVEYLDRDRFGDLLRWASRLEAIEAGTDPTAEAAFVARLNAGAEASGFRVDVLRECRGWDRDEQGPRNDALSDGRARSSNRRRRRRRRRSAGLDALLDLGPGPPKAGPGAVDETTAELRHDRLKPGPLEVGVEASKHESCLLESASSDPRDRRPPRPE